MTRAPLSVLVVVLALVAYGCDREPNRVARNAVGIGPSPVTTPEVKPLHIEYRVIGTIPDAHIVYQSASQGTTIVTSKLPWVAGFDTLQDTVFVSLNATSTLSQDIEGDLIVQIFVDGTLFRESRESGFDLDVTVSGEVTR